MAISLTTDPVVAPSTRSLGALPKKKAPRKSQDVTTRIIIVAIVIIVAMLVLVPLINVLVMAFSPGGMGVLGRLTAPAVVRTITNTMVLGVIVGALGTIVGFGMAYAQTHVQFRGKKIIHLITLLPIVSPPFAVATAFIALFGRGGIITNDLLGLSPNIYGLPGLSFVLTFAFFPVAYMNMLGMLKNMDPALDEASANLGGSRWRTFRKVTLPMLVPGFGGSFLLLFVEAIADLANPLVLGGNYPVLAQQAYIAINGQFDVGAASAYSLILLVPALLVFLLQRYWVSKRTVTTVTGKPTGRVNPIKTPAARIPILVFVGLVTGLIVLIYGTILVGGFVVYLGTNNAFTLANYQYVLGSAGADAVFTTIVLALIATPIAALLGLMIAWLVVRKLERWSGPLDFLGMLGLAVPGTVLGIGYAITYNTPVIIGNLQFFPALAGGSAIAGGAIGIVMVYVTRSLPTALRSGVSSLSQISPSIDEAAVSLGANSLTAFRTITLPIIRVAMLTGLTYAFARSMTTLSPILFITTPQTRIMTAEILGSVETGRFGFAFAYCTVLIGIVMLGIGLMSLLTSERFYYFVVRVRTNGIHL